MGQGLWLPLLWPRTSFGQESVGAQWGPKMSESPAGNFFDLGLVESPLSSQWDLGCRGPLRRATLYLPFLPHAPYPVAAHGSWEESRALGLGRGGTSP